LFVQAVHRPLRTARALINLEHVFHRGDELGVCWGGIHPLLLAMRVQLVF